jgi:glycosyltransferase 2 family protein
MKKKLIIGSALSILLIYLSVRGIDLNGVVEGLKSVKYCYLLSFLGVVFFIQLLRSFRWGEILRPLGKVDQLSLFSVTNVGFLAIVTFPARLGELARPYLITKKSNIRMSSALGTIFVERVFDGLSILLIAVFVPFFLPELPPWLIRSSIIFSVITIGMLIFMIVLIAGREKTIGLLNPLIKKFPERYAARIDNLIHHFIDGFKIFTDIKQLSRVAILSLLIWLINVGAICLMILAFSFNLPVAAAVVLMVILIIGIAIPTAPGFIGNWHYACILGLGLFGIPKTDALAFAIVYHFFSLLLTLALGLAALPFNRFSLTDLKTQWSMADNR